MERKRNRVWALYLSFPAAAALFLLISVFLIGGNSRTWIGELAELSGIWESAPCVWENPTLRAALEEEPARGLLREWTAERVEAAARGISIPQRKTEPLAEALYESTVYAAEQNGLSAYSVGVEAVAEETAGYAAELWGWVSSSCDAGGQYLPIRGLLLLSSPWFAVGTGAAFLLLELGLLRLLKGENVWLWLSLPPLFCAGGCLAVCRSGTEKSLAGQIAARLFEAYYGAGVVCFLACAVFLLLFAVPKRTEKQPRRRLNSDPAHPKGS